MAKYYFNYVSFRFVIFLGIIIIISKSYPYNKRRRRGKIIYYNDKDHVFILKRLDVCYGGDEMKKMSLSEMKSRNVSRGGVFFKNHKNNAMEAIYDDRNGRNYVRVHYPERGLLSSAYVWYLYNGVTGHFKFIWDSDVPLWVQEGHMVNKKQKCVTIPETKYFNGEPFELLYLEWGGGPEGGYATKKQAQKNAREWRESGDDCKARVIKIGNYYYVYGQ